MMSTDNQIKNPFKVPENYFDEVNRKILASTVEQPKVRRMSFIRRFTPVFAAAAAVAVLVTIGLLTLKVPEKNNMAQELSTVLERNPGIYLEELDLQTLEENIIINGGMSEESGLSDDAIIEYLISEEIDISDIYEKL